MSLHLLSIDFDGVLHRASDSVLVNFRPGTPPWQIELGLKAQKRFVWTSMLSNLIATNSIAIVIHSTWRKQYDDATLKHFLPPEIANKVISLDGLIENRATLSSDEYLFAALEIIAPTSLVVLDDRREFFPVGGKVHTWIAHNQGDFVWCNPDLGVSDPHTLQCLTSSIKKFADCEPVNPSPINSPK